LNGGDPAPLARALADAAGGTDAILRRASTAAAEGQLQLALELAEMAGDHAAARHFRAEVLERMAAQTANGVARNIYREAAAAERKAEDVK
jgi:alkyl sulfatase BDS1-like metallo-beta-lactamase superfamily hydrolase